jgi:hypothetical protein
MNTIPIPDIAEILRAHINTDNDARRLICEHILPLVGIDYDEIEVLQAKITELEGEIEDLNNSGDDE